MWTLSPSRAGFAASCLLALLSALGPRGAAADEPSYGLDVGLTVAGGDHVAGAEVVVWGPVEADDTAEPAHRSRGTSDAQGRVSLLLRKPGRYAVEVFAEQHRSFHGTADVRDPKFPHTYQVVLKPMTVFGLVVVARDAAAAPVPHARVALEQEDPDGGARPRVHHATTDAEGRARLNLPHAGTWGVEIRHPAFETDLTEVTVNDSFVVVTYEALLQRKPGASGGGQPGGTDPGAGTKPATEPPVKPDVGGPVSRPSRAFRGFVDVATPSVVPGVPLEVGVTLLAGALAPERATLEQVLEVRGPDGAVTRSLTSKRTLARGGESRETVSVQGEKPGVYRVIVVVRAEDGSTWEGSATFEVEVVRPGSAGSR